MRLILTAAVMMSLACASTGSKSFDNLLKGVPNGDEMVWSKLRAATYDGPECDRVLYGLGESDYNKKATTVDFAPETQVLINVCTRRSHAGPHGHEIPQWPRFEEIDAKKAYLASDDLHLNVINVALQVVDTANGQMFANWGKERPSYGEDSARPLYGVALFWTSVVTPEQVQQAVASLNLPPAAKAAFVKQYASAPRQLARANFTEGQRKLVVEIPAQVFRDRQAHFAAFKAEYAKLDELRAKAEAARKGGGNPDALVGELEQLRSAFLAKCAAATCRSQPVYGWATAELALIHVLRNDALSAAVESLLHTRAGSYVAGLPQAIRAAQGREEARIADGYAKYRRAKDSGTDEATAKQLAGGISERLDERLLMNPALELPNYAAALADGGKLYPENKVVAAVTPSGKEARISFKVDVIKGEEQYDCVRTNRIIRIRHDGTIEYEENCKYRPYTDKQLSHPPILVPLAEAKSVKPGDMLKFIASADKARVIEVNRKDTVIQVRADAVK